MNLLPHLPNQTLDNTLAIYDTVADQSRWTAVLDKITHDLNARGSLIFEIQEQALVTPYFSSWYQPDALADYNAAFFDLEMADQDVFLQHSTRQDGIEILPDSILYDDIEAFKQRKNVRYVMNVGILHRAAVLLNKDNPHLSRFSVQFGADRGGITPQEMAYLNQYLPHIAKALDLGRPARQLQQRHNGLLAAIDKLTIGVCLLDRNGCVILSNEEFDRQRDAYRTYRIAANGVLQLIRATDQQQLEALKEHAFNHGQFGARPRKEAIATDQGNVLCIEITPLHSADEIGTRAFDGYVVYSTDTSQPMQCNTSPLQQVFGLTETELALTDAISRGLTNAQIAERRNRSVSTVNAQVKSILSKTQCATRTQFVRLLMSFGIDFVDPSK